MFRSRYTELVGPLIIHAQHKLTSIVSETGGPTVPQPHFSAVLAANSGLPITPADYLQLQLRVMVDDADNRQKQESAAATNRQDKLSYSCTFYVISHFRDHVVFCCSVLAVSGWRRGTGVSALVSSVKLIDVGPGLYMDG